MKTLRRFSISLMLFVSLFCNAQNSAGIKEKIANAEAYLKQHPQNQDSWQQLYVLVNENYTKLSAADRTVIKKVLEQYGIWSTGTLLQQMKREQRYCKRAYY